MDEGQRKDSHMKLYEKDAYQTAFSGKVISCEKDGERWKIVLDQTCFYPEGGGQPADRGMLGTAEVLDVQEEEGKVVHWTDRPLEEGGQVQGQIDWQRRFYFMQNHTGEHLVSGLIHKKYGYENVGFHMNEEVITIDVGGVLSQEELELIEKEANEELGKGRPIEVLYPSGEELRTLQYRSKKEIEGQVRIVRIPGCDTCACCGTHVKNTMEIGLIKFLTMQHYKTGMRVSMICGKKAFEDYEKKHKSVMEISRMLSAKPEETAEAVSRLKEENQALKQRTGQLKHLFLEAKAAAISETQDAIFLWEDQLEQADLSYMMKVLMKKGKNVMVLVPGKDGLIHYAAGSRQIDSRQISKVLADCFSGRGGGSAQMVQGTVKGEKSEIEKVFFQILEEKEC